MAKLAKIKLKKVPMDDFFNEDWHLDDPGPYFKRDDYFEEPVISKEDAREIYEMRLTQLYIASNHLRELLKRRSALMMADVNIESIEKALKQVSIEMENLSGLIALAEE